VEVAEGFEFRFGDRRSQRLPIITKAPINFKAAVSVEGVDRDCKYTKVRLQKPGLQLSESGNLCSERPNLVGEVIGKSNVARKRSHSFLMRPPERLIRK